MKKFMVLYHAPDEFMAEAGDSTPEEMEEGMKQWMTWAEKCGDKLVDFGNPLIGGQKLVPGGKSDGSSRHVVGYSVLQAESMEDAKTLLTGHPHLDWKAECEIEVHEFMPVPGQG